MSLRITLPWRYRRARPCVGIAATIAVAGVLVLSVFPARAASTDISTDPFSQATCAASSTTNHHTIVEPDSYANGATIVAAFQVGRIYDGGACAIGFATSATNGASWTSGLLPGITKWTTAAGAGPYDRATDAAVAYDAKHGVWLISTLALTEAGGVKGVAVLTSRSTDGVTWSTPFTTASV